MRLTKAQQQQQDYGQTPMMAHSLAHELRRLLAPEGSGQLAVSVPTETLRQTITELEKANG